jgi:hypothetical protein
VLKTLPYRKLRSIFLYGVLLFFMVMMTKITLDYFPVQKNAAFLRIKQWVWREYATQTATLWFTAFYIHVFTSCFCLLAGFTQFSPSLLRTCWHRKMGTFYIFVVLTMAAPSGLVMSFFANGGLWSIAAFVLLSLLWLISTGMALYTVKRKKYAKHGAWMIISYALTLSALTLRAWKWGLVNLSVINWRPMELYQIVAWLGWVPNLLIALWIIKKNWHLQLLKNKTPIK